MLLLAVIVAILLTWPNPADADRLHFTGLRGCDPAAINLSTEELVRHTNAYRTAQGLPPLTMNPLLNKAALARAIDMQTHGYFDHQNPMTGLGPAEAIAATGYSARTATENIANGTWSSNQALVQVWIDSPSHRANILDPEVREIGMALVQDHRVASGCRFVRLYAVQLFGRPLSDCGKLPSEDEHAALMAIEERLESLHTQLRAMQIELDDMQAQIERAESRMQANQWIQQRNQRVTDFNHLVAASNQVQETLAERVDAFNAAIAEFNACGGDR